MATNNGCNYDPTQHYVLVGGANGSITSVSPSTSGYVLTSNGTGSDPSFQPLIVPVFTSINTQVFTYTGSTQTYTPTANMAYCIVRIVGGGGGGGGKQSNGGATGGGGGGEYAIGIFSSSTVGSSQSVTIGAGGIGGTDSNGLDGTSGGTTSFGSLLTAIGGSGSQGTSTSGADPVGAGGTGGTGGYLHVQGSAGLPPGNYVAPSGGFVTGGYYTGAGGSSLLSGINMVAHTSGTNAAGGTTGQSYGGGASGCASPQGGVSGASAAYGSPGICIITEYIK